MKFGTWFSGFGGYDIGAVEAGAEPVFAVEYDPAIAGVYRANFGDHVTVASVLDLVISQQSHVDLFHVSPPCPNFSPAKANAKEAANDIAMANKIAEYITFHKPLFFTLENVIAYRDSQSWAIIARALHDCGYSFKWWHVNMADYGVPQTRKRMIAVARRDGKAASFPATTHAKEPMPTLFSNGLVKWVGWYEAVEDLIPTLPDSQFAPWQLDRLPAEYKESRFLNGMDMKSTGRQMKGRITTEPAATVTADDGRRPSTTPSALLVGNGDTRRPIVDGGTPSTTLGASNGFRAFLPHAQVNSGTAGKYGDEPATTIGATKQPDKAFVNDSLNCSNKHHSQRAFIAAQGKFGEHLPTQDESTPVGTVTANSNQLGIKTFMVNESSAMEVRQIHEPVASQVASPRNNNQKAFIMDAANPHSNGQIKHRYENEPTKTITSSDVLHRANIGRVVKMTPRALARFQSFPDWYKLPECSRKKSEKRLLEYFVYGNPVVLNWATSEYLKTDLTLSCRGIGNAVPSLFAKKLVVHLLESLA